MKIKYIVCGLLLLTVGASAQTKGKVKAAPAPAGLPRPKLVVGIVIDQMRWDYLYRYYDRYQAGGFKRMLNEGFTCENTQIDYLPTETAPGHSCIYTGSVPAIHGIAANEFIIQATGKQIYCTDDSAINGVGTTSIAGKMSPRNLQATTITDQLRLATNFRSKVIGIALKDRASILPAGHTPTGAYWFDDTSGNWITSTYYTNDLPAWVKGFNEGTTLKNYLSKQWTTLYPAETYVQSTADNSPYEGKYRGETAPVFPHDLAAISRNNFYGAIRSSPFGISFTLDFARTAIENEQLGKHPETDFLAVSLSSTDYVGHQFGPNSMEVEDIYLRLDKDLAAFFSYLDAKVGKGNYTAFLTADHGAAHNPKFLMDHEMPAGYFNPIAVAKELNAMLEKKYDAKNLVLEIGSYEVNLNNPLIEEKKLNADVIKFDVINYLQKLPGVLYVVDCQKAQMAAVPEWIRTRIINGYNPEHSGSIIVILKSGFYGGAMNATGTTHGTWSPYDTHIPLLFMGWGVQHGSLNRETHMTDISATLAALLHIQVPSGCIGQPIPEVLKK
ncbi:alkaline phosphatase family protein [Mucilaginibacter sp. RS28]|uniref:Alkaline phosphatase family protein n=1 Tax=Mucilaginibacter straminoryzae TaxID=2932774 RepID=A0A9X2BDQ7_9SPHI|nr:alkaline phosphatase PafA [Mucilaginibacter straminoryzae]MCJ8210588.1 alkaline phosphatase family protein [Mucilaginibacter straminoryzae]